MKIIKIAQGGIPAGYVRVQFDAGEQDQRTEILGHGPGTSCKTQNDDLLLEDLLNIEIEGFGDTEIDGGGLTAEGYRAKQSERPKAFNPLNVKPEKTKAPFTGPFGKQDQKPKDRQSYGV